MITLLERIPSPLLSKRRFLPITWFGLWFTYLIDNKKTDKQIPSESKVKTSLHNYEQDQVLRNYIVMKQNDSVFVCRSDLCYDRGRHSAGLNAVNYWWLIATFFLSPACWCQVGSSINGIYLKGKRCLTRAILLRPFLLIRWFKVFVKLL